MKRSLLALAALACLGSLAFAEGGRGAFSFELQGDYQFPYHAAVDASGLVPIVYGVIPGDAAHREVGSSWGPGEIKAIFGYKLSTPFLAGQGALTKDNSLAFDATGEISPVSLNANFQATITPIAFLKFDAGAGVGTGWNIGFTGLGINDNGNIVPQDFGGLVYRAWIEGTFQFDLAAVLPGDWNHVVVVASPKVQYQAYSNSKGQPWIWEADDAMNIDGLKLTGSYLVGYQMPIVLDLAALLLQTESYIGAVAASHTMASGGWGSDFTYLTFGPIFDFKLSSKSTLAILPQFKTGIKWSDSTTFNLFFENRVYSAPFLYFYRVAFDYNLKL